MYLYLAVNERAINTVLLREDEGSQRLVYYVSRALRGAKERYSPIETVAFALLVAVRKLRPYFQAHTVVIPNQLAIKKTLQNIETSGRLM